MTNAPPLPSSRRLLFADEFDVPGPPDPARWDYQLDMRYRDSDAQFTDHPANVRVEDGQLVIEARREDAQGRRYTSAELVTLDRFACCYGRVEVRARLPGGRGTWPGVWIVGADIREVSWPACGEAEVVENVGFAPERIVLAAHMPAHNHARGNPIRLDLNVPDARTAFHVYALEWTPDRLEFDYAAWLSVNTLSNSAGLTIPIAEWRRCGERPPCELREGADGARRHRRAVRGPWPAARGGRRLAASSAGTWSRPRRDGPRATEQLRGKEPKRNAADVAQTPTLSRLQGHCDLGAASSARFSSQ